MRVRSMQLEGFGPFKDQFTIDFDAVSASGLFLLEGPTGAGKSSLVDAIVFALYGSVAAREGSSDRIRSDFAASATPTYVDIVVDTRDGLLRIRRAPAFARPKARGQGTTTQPATMLVWRLSPQQFDEAVERARAANRPLDHSDLDAAGDLLTNRIDEGSKAVRGAIGLSREEFTQTVVLPQGQFMNFLNADPSERSSILEKVFGTEIYDAVAKDLSEQTRFISQRIAAAQATTAAAREAVWAALGAVSGTREIPQSARTHIEEVRGWHAELLRDVEAAAAQVQAAQLAHDNARVQFEAAQRRVVAGERRAELRAELAKLDGTRDHIDRLRAAVEDATRAAGAQPAIENLRHLWQQVHPQVERITALADQWRGEVSRGARRQDTGGAQTPALTWTGALAPDTAWSVYRETLSALAAGCTTLASEVADGQDAATRSLEGLRADLAAWNTLKQAIAAATTEAAHLARAQEEAKRASAAQEAADAQRNRMQQALIEAQRAATETSQVEAELTLAEGDCERLTRAIATCEGLVATEVKVATARAEVDAAHETLRDLRNRQAEGFAAALARNLAPGAACPVCGSTDHPAAAKAALGDEVRESDLADQEAVVKRLEAVAASLATTVAADTARLHEIVAGCSPQVGELPRWGEGASLTFEESVEALRRAAERAVVRRDDLQGKARAARDASKRVEAAQEEHRAADAQREVALQRASQTQGTLLQVQAQYAERMAQMRDALAAAPRELERGVLVDGGDTGALAVTLKIVEEEEVAASERVAATNARLQAATSVATELAALARQREDLERALERAQEVAREAGFAEPSDVSAAAVSQRKRQEWSAQIRASDEARARIEGELRSVELAALPEVVVDERPARAAALEQARKVYEERDAHHRTLSVDVATLGQRLADFDAAQREEEKIAQENNALVTVASLINGTDRTHNPDGLTLPIYVLQRRFDEVVEEASRRLAVISDGRYELHRSENKENSRARRIGLALQVRDNHTGALREPKSLSGGEQFYMSLCLALALADVVTAHAGGIDMGMLFVDEGFGSLSPEVLEVVMDILGGLVSSGRVVGVISHVEQMKQRIADRIEVRPIRDGPSTLRVLAGQ